MSTFIYKNSSVVLSDFSPYTLSYTNPFIFIESFSGVSAGENLYLVEHRTSVINKYVRSNNIFLVLKEYPAFILEKLPDVSFTTSFTISTSNYLVYSYFTKANRYSKIDEEKFYTSTVSLLVSSSLDFSDAEFFFLNFLKEDLNRYSVTISTFDEGSQEYISAQLAYNEIRFSMSLAIEEIKNIENFLNESFQRYLGELNVEKNLKQAYDEINSYLNNNYSVFVKPVTNRSLYKTNAKIAFQDNTLYVYGEDRFLHAAEEVLLVKKIEHSYEIVTQSFEPETFDFSDSAYANNIFSFSFAENIVLDLLEVADLKNVASKVSDIYFGEIVPRVNFSSFENFVKFGSATSLIKLAFKSITFLRKYDEIILSVSAIYPERAEKLKEIKANTYASLYPFVKWFYTSSVDFIEYNLRPSYSYRTYALSTLDFFYNNGSLTQSLTLLPLPLWEEVQSDFNVLHPGVNFYQVLFDLHLYAASDFDIRNSYRLSSKLPENIFDPSYLEYLDLIGSLIDILYFADEQSIEIDIAKQTSFNNTDLLSKQLGINISNYDELNDSINRIVYHLYNKSSKLSFLKNLVESLDLKNKNFQFDIITSDKFISDEYFVVESYLTTTNSFVFSRSLTYTHLLGFFEFNEHLDIKQNALVSIGGTSDSLTLSFTFSNPNPFFINDRFSYLNYTKKGSAIVSMSLNVYKSNSLIYNAQNHVIASGKDLEKGFSLIPFSLYFDNTSSIVVLESDQNIITASFSIQNASEIYLTSSFLFLAGETDVFIPNALEFAEGNYSFINHVTYSTKITPLEKGIISFTEDNIRHIAFITENAIKDSTYEPDVSIVEKHFIQNDDSEFSAILFSYDNLTNRMLNFARSKFDIKNARLPSLENILEKTRAAILLLREIFKNENFFAGVVIAANPITAFSFEQKTLLSSDLFLETYKNTSFTVSYQNEMRLTIDSERLGTIFKISAENFPKADSRRNNTQITFPALVPNPALASDLFSETAVLKIYTTGSLTKSTIYI